MYKLFKTTTRNIIIHTLLLSPDLRRTLLRQLQSWIKTNDQHKGPRKQPTQLHLSSNHDYQSIVSVVYWNCPRLQSRCATHFLFIFPISTSKTSIVSDHSVAKHQKQDAEKLRARQSAIRLRSIRRSRWVSWNPSSNMSPSSTDTSKLTGFVSINATYMYCFLSICVNQYLQGLSVPRRCRTVGRWCWTVERERSLDW